MERYLNVMTQYHDMNLTIKARYCGEIGDIKNDMIPYKTQYCLKNHDGEKKKHNILVLHMIAVTQKLAWGVILVS